MLNRFEAIGRLGHEPKLETKGQTTYARFSIAVQEDRKQPDGSRNVDWINCVAFGKLADIVGQYATKGMQVFVGGRLTTNKYQTRNGDNATSFEIIAEKFYILDWQNNGGQSNFNGQPANYTGQQQQTSQNQSQAQINNSLGQAAKASDPFANRGDEVQIDDSDLPF